MNTEDLIEHLDFVVKHNNPNNYVDVGFLELTEVGRIRQGLVLLQRLEQREEADRLNREWTHEEMIGTRRHAN